MAVALLLLLGLSGAEGWLDAALLSSRTLSPACARHAALRMGAVPVADFQGASKGEEDVNLRVAKSGAYLVHRKVVAEQANMRLGLASTKTRGEVRGGGRKPFKQKGTGNARQGSIRTPLKRGGGVSFGPKPKSWHIDMNKKEKQLAISTALMCAPPSRPLPTTSARARAHRCPPRTGRRCLK